MTWREIERGLRADGWLLVRRGGNHDVYRHPAKPGRIAIPRHPMQIARSGTLADMLRVAGITEDELRRLT